MKMSAIVDDLCTVVADPSRPRDCMTLPSRAAVIEAVEAVRSAFFPYHSGAFDLNGEELHWFVGAALEKVAHILEVQIGLALCFSHREPQDPSHAKEIVAQFLGRLPRVRALVDSDVEAAYDGDPALRSRDEAIFSYPGIFAVTSQRLAHELQLLGVPLLPRMITEHAHSLTGIDIHPGAAIGARFFIDHGTGVVIGETARIGDNVRLYQGVTLGARSFAADAQGRLIKGVDRHPVVEDDVVIYAGATVLGRITIGRGSVIGGNVWLTNSVPVESRVTQAAPSEVRFELGAGI